MTDAVSRRRVLAAGAGVASVPALAACAGGEEPTVEDVASGTVLTATADVPVGGGVITDAVVVTQPTAGEFKGFSSTCTHQACQVGSVADRRIVCGCHGSAFSIEDGSVESGPARSPLPEIEITVEGDQVRRA